MAACRLVQFRTTISASSHTHHHFLPPNPYLLPLNTKPRIPRLRLYLVHSQSQAQAQPIVQSEENIAEEDVFSKTRLLVQNVPWTSTGDDIRPLFEKYGTVVDIELSMYNKSRNRGLAFVSMASEEEAAAALSNLESTEFEGRVLKLNWAKLKKTKATTPPQAKPMPVHNLFVANLPFGASSQELKDFFNANNANVVFAEIIYHDNPRRPAGYGFVSFNSKADADAALNAFQGKEFMGRPIRVARSKRFLRQGTKNAFESEREALKSFMPNNI
ncbi:RNA-binding (RRM/RBD/RNP motifs) family protein [Striga hermonthica]|uniref:RNA-binding (RRM/RBD/RNP motifs) family protein n=1 Tax=Striga hermonthica TaxID=68872 RepID=A0A9N7RT44_STRHE|nr:RNA-binding (RRM/RBD/RNP motifs) family protein [Striga hermonthica]